jgi:hypothetical protein
MRKVCLFATQHQFQLDSPMDSAFDARLRELIQDHNVDCILEEATGLPRKSCVELLADDLKIRWDNIDLSVGQPEEDAGCGAQQQIRYFARLDPTFHTGVHVGPGDF